jgi:hypothetical protein
MERYRLDEILGVLGLLEIFSSLPLERLSSRLSDPSQLRIFRRSLEKLKSHCGQLDLKASAKTINTIDRILERASLDLRRLSDLLEVLLDRIRDELEEIVFFSLSLKEAGYYRDSIEGWELIAERFPSSLDDIEEARKCFAVSRYAACVFHATHIIEAGLIELGTFIGVNDPHSGWTAVSGALSSLLKKSYNDLTDFEKENKPFLEQVQGTVEAMKNSWRNKISHTEGKLYVMTTDFSPEIAEEILYAARAFMRKLAEGLPGRT